jgi:hypothetical protein
MYFFNSVSFNNDPNSIDNEIKDGLIFNYP